MEQKFGPCESSTHRYLYQIKKFRECRTSLTCKDAIKKDELVYFGCKRTRHRRNRGDDESEDVTSLISNSITKKRDDWPLKTEKTILKTEYNKNASSHTAL